MRLTNDNYENDVLSLKNKTQAKYNEDLWQYAKVREDIEEELGIDLIVFLKMTLGTKVYTKHADLVGCKNCEDGILEQRFHSYDYSVKSKVFCICDFTGTKTPVYYVKDYGKTWSLDKNDLTKEELE